MTRFSDEYTGKLGEFWKQEAQRELAKVQKEIEDGQITFVNGVAYNRIGRVVMDDMAEKISYVDSRIDIEATSKARSEEVRKQIEQLRKQPERFDGEMMAEMRNSFGKGTTVVNVLTGRKFRI